MNEPIIVDGVDVSSCPYFCDYKDLTHLCQNGLGNLYCRENANCYYKQIQRLKEENEILFKELQYKYEEMDAKGFLLMGEDLNFWKNLKSENEKLKKEVSDLNFYIASYRQVWEIDKYRKALEEIRDYISTLSIVDSDFVNTETYLRITEIIGEVLSESADNNEQTNN